MGCLFLNIKCCENANNGYNTEGCKSPINLFYPPFPKFLPSGKK